MTYGALAINQGWLLSVWMTLAMHIPDATDSMTMLMRNFLQHYFNLH